MRQWEVHKFPLPVAEQPHYFVVLSPDLVAADLREGPVNLLMCRTLRPADRALKPTGILLDEVDGFSRKTVVDCLSIYQAAKSLARDPLGSISPTRRRAIARKVIDCFRLQA